MDRFIESQKQAADDLETLPTNEAVFYNDIDLHKYCCDIIPIQQFQRITGIDYDDYRWMKKFAKNSYFDRNTSSVLDDPITFVGEAPLYVSDVPRYRYYNYEKAFPMLICEKGEPDMSFNLPDYSKLWIDKKATAPKFKRLLRANNIDGIVDYSQKQTIKMNILFIVVFRFNFKTFSELINHFYKLYDIKPPTTKQRAKTRRPLSKKSSKQHTAIRPNNHP